jgi:hypothetical protein
MPRGKIWITTATAAATAAFLIASATGCGNSGLAKVSGRVTVGGRPVTSGMIMFYPASGPGAVGEIMPDGTYTLTTYRSGDGAAIGTHAVAIHATSIGAGSLVEAKSIADELRVPGQPASGKILVPGQVRWLVPEKYSLPATSPLTAEVKPGDNSIPFEIPAE